MSKNLSGLVYDHFVVWVSWFYWIVERKLIRGKFFPSKIYISLSHWHIWSSNRLAWHSIVLRRGFYNRCNACCIVLQFQNVHMEINCVSLLEPRAECQLCWMREDHLNSSSVGFLFSYQLSGLFYIFPCSLALITSVTEDVKHLKNFCQALCYVPECHGALLTEGWRSRGGTCSLLPKSSCYKPGSPSAKGKTPVRLIFLSFYCV